MRWRTWCRSRRRPHGRAGGGTIERAGRVAGRRVGDTRWARGVETGEKLEKEENGGTGGIKKGGTQGGHWAPRGHAVSVGRRGGW